MKVAKVTLFNGDEFVIGDCDSANPLEEDVANLCKALRSRFTEDEIEQAQKEGRMSEVTILDMSQKEYHRRFNPRPDFPTGIFDRQSEKER